MSEELKPCPFCGGEAYIKEESDSFSNIQSIIRCSGCHAAIVVDVDMTKKDDWNKQKAIEKWNKRLSPWQTGTPTEEGWYLVLWRDTVDDCEQFTALMWNNSNKTWYDVFTPDCNWVDEYHAEVIAWKKIEPYKKD